MKAICFGASIYNDLVTTGVTFAAKNLWHAYGAREQLATFVYMRKTETYIQ